MRSFTDPTYIQAAFSFAVLCNIMFSCQFVKCIDKSQRLASRLSAADDFKGNVNCQLWQPVFPLWTLTGENERERGLTGWTTALDWELARSDSLAAGKELVTGPKVPSDLLQLKSGHSENLDFIHLFFVLRYSSSKYNSSMKFLDVNRLTRVRALLLSYNSN